jgi:multidrug efflux pump
MTNGMQLTNFSGMSLNIYTQVGLVTLIGVISKHGILIVDFANRMQEEGMSKREAIEEASSIRLRPILMTTAALVVAMVPLLLATGPGAASRFSLGMVISSGMTIGTLFTLFVVPAMYMYIGRDHQALGQSKRMVGDELHAGV